MLKRTTAFILCFLLLLCASVTAYAKTYLILDDFKVSKNSDGSFELAGYNGTETDITIPEEIFNYAVTSVESRAFAENADIKSMVLPDSLVTVNNGAFSDAPALTDIKLGANTENLGSNVFYNCPKLKNVDLGKAVNEIRGYTFNRCASLVKIELPQSVKKIGEYAFYRCTSLEYILIPSSVTQIAANAFDECNKLTIYGEVGSYAQEYAKEYSIPFASSTGGEINTEPPTGDITLGDVDGNGIIDEDDSRILQMFCANFIDRSYIVAEFSDVNYDGILNIKDCTSIQKYIEYGKF